MGGWSDLEEKKFVTRETTEMKRTGCFGGVKLIKDNSTKANGYNRQDGTKGNKSNSRRDQLASGLVLLFIEINDS